MGGRYWKPCFVYVDERTLLETYTDITGQETKEVRHMSGRQMGPSVLEFTKEAEEITSPKRVHYLDQLVGIFDLQNLDRFNTADNIRQAKFFAAVGNMTVTLHRNEGKEGWVDAVIKLRAREKIRFYLHPPSLERSLSSELAKKQQISLEALIIIAQVAPRYEMKKTEVLATPIALVSPLDSVEVASRIRKFVGKLPWIGDKLSKTPLDELVEAGRKKLHRLNLSPGRAD